jgi:hexosaminidase
MISWKKLFTAFAAGALIAAGAAAQNIPALDIVPKPVSVVAGSGTFVFDRNTVIVVPAGNRELADIAEYCAQRIAETTGLHPAVRTGTPPRRSIVLRVGGAGSKPGDESYRIAASTDSVVISAPNPVGVFWGVQTLRQMLASGGKTSPAIPAAVIEDVPAYGWRGFSFDCARHFMSKEAVKRTIDLLAYHKMNVLHWHLTDDQGWRIEIKKYPRLTEVGAWRIENGQRTGGFYTQDDVREVVAYAKSRYVMVVPEIETPGHATAALAAYPQFSCTGEQLTVEPKWGVFPNLFCAGKEETFSFIEDIVREIAPLFPSPYIHIGGDEAAKDKWKVCPLCQKRIKDERLADEEALQGYFSRRMDTFVRSIGKTMIGWDEILLGNPSQTAVVESWRGMDGALKGAAAGHKIISAPSNLVYFDYPELNERTHISWMQVLPMQRVYTFDPTPKGLPTEQAGLITGGECTLWSEYVFEYELGYKLFPRMCAFCETVWTPTAGRDWADFSRRMVTHMSRLAAMGVDSFTPMTQVGSWNAGDVAAGGTTLQFDVTKFVTAPGYYRFAIHHDAGANGVAIARASLLAGGKEISSDTHDARSSMKRNEYQNYRFSIGEVGKGTTYTLRVNLSADGGVDTNGSVWVHFFKPTQ